MDTLTAFWSEIVSAIVGALVGSGATYAISIKKSKNTASGGGKVVDQSGASAGGDMAGGDIKKK